MCEVINTTLILDRYWLGGRYNMYCEMSYYKIIGM